MSANDQIFHFDNVTVDRTSFRVHKDGQCIALTPRAFNVLVLLLENGGRVVEKQEIFDSIWKGTFVSDNALARVIKEIRYAIGDSADEPRYIETVITRGYRFIGEIGKDRPNLISDIALSEPTWASGGQVSSETEGSGLNPRALFSALTNKFLIYSSVALVAIAAFGGWFFYSQRGTDIPAAKIRTLAVLPFKPLNADSRDESLEMGMTETLITRLSNLKKLVVRPMSAVIKYTDLQQDSVKAGQETSVEAVLDGSIQKAGERIRVTVRLIDVGSGTSLWSEQFDENFVDIFKVQDSIAERVAHALMLELSRSDKKQLTKQITNSPRAYQLYSQGQYIWHRAAEHDWIDQSCKLYQQALVEDPDFALAHVEEAECFMHQNVFGSLPGRDAAAKARNSIMKALEIDPTLAEAHLALAELTYQFQYDWLTAEKEFRTAIELNPNVAKNRMGYGWFLMSAGRFDEAAVEMEESRKLDPNSRILREARGLLLYFSRQYDQAIEYYQMLLQAEPDSDAAYGALRTVYAQKQMYAEATDAQLKMMSHNGAKPAKLAEYRKAIDTSGWQGYLRVELKNLEERSKAEYVPPYRFANLFSRLGEKDKAFEWLEKAFDQRDAYIVRLKTDPALDGLRDDPRYSDLIRRIGLVP